MKKSCFQSESELGTIRNKGGDFTAAGDDKSDYEAGIGLNDGDRRPCHPRPPASGFPIVESAHQDAKIEFGDMDSDSVCGRSRVRAAMPVACRRDPASELDQLAAPAHGLASDPRAARVYSDADKLL